MRKIVIVSIALVFAAGSVFAQEETKKERGNKDFSEILPHAGDFALGLDMAYFIKSIHGSIMQPTAVNNPTVMAPQQWQRSFGSDFFGKYFLTNKSALRARLGIRIDNFTEREFVADDVANLLNPLGNDPITMEQTVDVWKQRNTMIELGIGYEYRRSLWRVQGYVGGEVFGGIVPRRDYFEYGNPMTATNQAPTTTSWWDAGGNPVNMDPLGTGSYRGLDSKTFGFTAGAAAFIGADLFICRNVSIGAEFNLEARYMRFGEETMKTETWLLDQVYVADEKVKPFTSSFGINPWGRLNLMIYF